MKRHPVDPAPLVWLDSRANRARPLDVRRAFTLVELLVVITIIVALLAVLAPALDRAMETATTLVCQTNLRLWTQGMYAYALDNRRSIIEITERRNNYWHWRLAKYVGEPDYGKGPAPPAGQYEILKANRCPKTRLWVAGHPTVYGDAQRMWAYGGISQGAYGLNLWTTTFTVNASQSFSSWYTNIPGDVPFIGDSAWVGSWPDNNDTPSDNHYNGDSNAVAMEHRPGTFMNRFVVSRHGMAINVGYVDQSVKLVPLGDLWMQRWHKSSKPNPDHRDYYRGMEPAS